MRMLTVNEVRLWNTIKDGEPYALKGASTVRGGGHAIPAKVNGPYSTDCRASLKGWGEVRPQNGQPESQRDYQLLSVADKLTGPSQGSDRTARQCPYPVTASGLPL